MIYSKDDVKRMLATIKALIPKWQEECLHGDSIKEEAAEELERTVNEIEESL